MKTYRVTKNKNFVGRELESKRINEIYRQAGSKILVVYGRRRVGKTELMEQLLGKRGRGGLVTAYP